MMGEPVWVGQRGKEGLGMEGGMKGVVMEEVMGRGETGKGIWERRTWGR